MLRVEVWQDGRDALPAIDVDEPAFVIGSDPTARVRLPASVARPDHVRIDGDRYRTDDAAGAIGDGHTFRIGAYSVRVSSAPAGAVAAPPQRTQSLARELMRNLLVSDNAPTLEIERGPNVGTKRALAPPDSTLVIGRGDEAMWVILDRDLSKLHAEIRRSWDGVRVIDLKSKNGTRIDGVSIQEAELRDGSALELGNVVLRYRDPAERHLAAEPPSVPVELAAANVTARTTPVVFYAAVVVMALAIAGIVWVVLS